MVSRTMWIGLLMLVMPGILFLATFAHSRRFRPGLRVTYRLLGALVVFPGSAISVYLASYTGDQGGIAAYFFQIAVIVAYLTLSISCVGLNWLLVVRQARRDQHLRD